jgi:hypothetical protein
VGEKGSPYGTRKGLKRYPFLPQAKKIQAESPVRRPQSGRRMRPKKENENSYAFILILPGFFLQFVSPRCKNYRRSGVC